MKDVIIVSIILPTCNGEKYINKAIESVLSQNFSNWELLIVDDGSTDRTQSVVNKYSNLDSRIKYLKNDVNLGIQKSLNKGLVEAKGKYIARIDDDDEWLDKDKLKVQYEFLENNRDFVLVGTGVVVIEENGKELFRYLLTENDNKIRNRLLSRNCFVHSSVMFRREATLKFNGYSENEEDKHIEDYDLWLKLGTIGKFTNLPIYGINFMARSGSISSVNKLEQFRKNISLIKKYKNQYPNYITSIIWSYLRVLFYRVYSIFPNLPMSKVIKYYKEF